MNGKVTYHQQVSYCGKPRCKRCREGVGHGPYWYAYQTVDGKTSRTYIGKHLPPEAQAQLAGTQHPSAAPVAEREQSTLRIYVLGQFRLERRNPRDPLDWQTVTESAWQHQRVRALLGCLVSVGGRKLGREQIMEALWPDLDIDVAGSRLDRAVYSLRQLFEPSRSRPATSPLLLTEREMIVLAGHPQVWIDADAFEALIAQAHGVKADPGEKERLLKEAFDLYSNELLPEDRRNEWTRLRRESLQRSYIGLLLERADLFTEREAYANAIDQLDRLLAIDPTNEAAVQRLIKLLAQLGRRGEALRAYKKLVDVLWSEYNIVPLPETRKLYEDLRSGSEKTTRTNEVASIGAENGVREFQVTSAAAGESPAVQIGRAHQSPLVGRQQELESLSSLVSLIEHTAKFRLAAQKRSALGALDPHRKPQCVLLMGDVGIGKTRLAEEMGREAKRRGWAVAWSRVYSQEGTISYRLWTEVLRKAMQQGVWQREEVRKRPISFHSLCALLPELQELLPPVEFPPSLSPEQEQLRLWEATKDLLVLVSQTTPLLIVLDDLQWADTSSCELLAYLARRTHGYPILIIGTCRENELRPDHTLRPLLTDLRRENAVETLHLEPLSPEQIVSLVTQVTQAAEPMVQHISTRAAGNPFFAEELARTIADSVESGLRESEVTLPDTISAVLTLRLGRLSTLCQRLLSKAAVLGGSFEFQEISAMEANSPGYDEDRVLELLEEALRSGMLTEEGTGTRIKYTFWHPLLESHLYELPSAARRASQHRRAAQVLISLYKGREEEYAARITNHLVNGGGEDEQITRYAEIAGDHALSLSSYAEAEKFFHITLEHLGAGSVDWLHRAYIHECLGVCTFVLGRFEEAHGVFMQALEDRQRHGVTEVEEREAEAQIQAMLWCEIGKTWHNRGDIEHLRQSLEQGKQILEEAGVLRGLAWANLKFRESYISFSEGNYDETRQKALEALGLFEEGIAQQRAISKETFRFTLTKRTLAGDPVDIGRTYVMLGNVEATGARCVDGLPHFRKALAIFEQYNCLRDVAIASCNEGDIYLRSAEYQQAQAALRRALNIVERIGDIPVSCFVLGNLGILGIRIGNLTDAEAELRKSVIRADTIVKDPGTISLWYAYLATALLEQGRMSDARAALLRALSQGRIGHLDPFIGIALVVLGNFRIAQAVGLSSKDIDADLYLRKKNILFKRARKFLEKALALDGLQEETKTECRVALAQSLLSLDQAEEALVQAQASMEEASQSGLTWLVARVHRLLGDIDVVHEDFVEAENHYNQALHISERCGMRLEYGRVLQQLGTMLLHSSQGELTYQRGLKYLQEALPIFVECQAETDKQLLSQALQSYALPLR